MQRQPVETHCPYCALQCAMTLSPTEAGWDVAPREFPSNKGALCRKGFTAAELLGRSDRLTTPLIRDRRDGPLRPAAWDEALDLIASRVKTIQAGLGHDAIGVFGGGGLTNEKAYLLGKFARVALRTANIDYNGRFCMASGAVAGQKAFGIDRGLPFPLDDIPGAETILLTGGNPAETMPPVMQYFDAQKRRGGKLIVVDPRATPTALQASLHLQLTPGTDAALANGILHVILQHNLVDRAFIERRTTGFDRIRRIAASYWLDRVERITGVPGAKVTQAAHMIAEAATAMLLTGRGTEQQTSGVDNVLAFINVMLATGQAGRVHCGFGCMTGQGNGQGGREHGQKADQLPGYRKIADPAARGAVAKVWGIDPASLPGPGLPAVELFDACGRDIAALMVFGANPIVSAPNASHVAQRLRALDLLVVADIFLSDTAAIADVVLPITQWAEEDGTMTNLEGRIIRRRQALAAPEGVRSDIDIIAGLAVRLGAPSSFPTSPADIFTELRAASAGGVADYNGITWDRIDAHQGMFWPCPETDHPGSPRLFLSRFAREDGRARFHPIEHRDPFETPGSEYPYYLTTGRTLAHYQSGTQTRRVRSLDDAEPEAYVEIHPATARTHRIAPGDMVRLTTARGAGLFRARLTPTIRIDTLFVPFHFAGDGCANVLTSSAVDPTSRIPEFKVAACALQRVSTGPAIHKPAPVLAKEPA